MSSTKRSTEAERLEKEARAFVEKGGEGKLKKTLTDYVREKDADEPKPKKKKRMTEAERLEAEARNFVERQPGVPDNMKRSLTDFVWDKESVRQGIRPHEDKDAEMKDKDVEKKEDQSSSSSSPKKGTKRKAKESSDSTPSDDAKQQQSSSSSSSSSGGSGSSSSGGGDMPDWKIQEYSRFAGQQRISGAARDLWGNARGNEFDLIRDNAMKGRNIVVVNLVSIDFSRPNAALKQKGFNVTELNGGYNSCPSAATLKKELDTASQLWVISGLTKLLTDEHLDVIMRFFKSGGGLYIWGDNEPLYADANFITKEIFGVTMTGNVRGDKNVGLSKKKGKAGFQKHLMTTGIESLYEGITIATVHCGEVFEPLVWGSADNVVVALYEKEGRRCLMDGGFTRLYYKWDAAGTARFVKNCAGWLANLEAGK